MTEFGHILVNLPSEVGDRVGEVPAAHLLRSSHVKLVCDVMEAPVWLCPDHTVKMAFVVMKGLGTGSIAVVESGAYLGMLRWSDLVDLDPDDALLQVMRRDSPYIGPAEPIESAARILAESGLERLPVVEHHVLVGMVAATSLLMELGRASDPLTGLPWSDTLRDWAISRLRSSQEISIIFFDLDDFGQYNKQYGHMIGDQVLQAVAATLGRGMESGLDVLCRYGGDEFAVATIRGKDASESFAGSLAREIAAIPPPGSTTPITTSWGVTGGKRTKEREDTHYAATLDNLINMASRQCQAMKESRMVEAPTVPVDPEVLAGEDTEVLTLRSLNVTAQGESATVSVELRAAGMPVSASLSGASGETALLKLVAQTAADAVSHALPKDTTLVVHDCRVTKAMDGGQYAQVLATLYTPTHMKELQGTAMVEGDANRAAAVAMLRAAEQDVAELTTSTNGAS